MKKYSVFTLVLLTLTFISITSNAQTIANIQTNDPLCFASFSGDLSLDINPSPNTTDVTVQLFWFNPNSSFWIQLGNSFGPNNNFSFPNLGSGDYRVDLKNTISGNLLDVAFFTLVDPSEFIVNIFSNSDITCNGGTVNLSITTTGGTNPINSYTWSN